MQHLMRTATQLRPGRTGVVSCVKVFAHMSSAAVPLDRAKLLNESWTHAARLYLQELVPRFTPWLLDAVQVLVEAQAELPPGQPVLLPCCGPGHEIPLVHRVLEGAHPVLGSDLARGMVHLSREVIQAELAGRLYAPDPSPGAQHTPGAQPPVMSSTAPQSQVEQAVSTVLQAAAQHLGHTHVMPVPGGPQPAGMDVQVLDACLLDQQHSGTAAAVLSVFGLQQLGPLAPQALSSWVRCLAPGGLAVIVMWPAQVEPAGGPWAAYGQALTEQLAAQRAASQAATPAAAGQATPAAAGQATPAAAGQATPAAAGHSKQSVQQQQAAGSQGGDAWEEQLVPTALQVPDCQVVLDTLVQHTMTWQDVDMFWEVMTQGGPWHARRLMSGDAFMDELKQRWLGLLQQQHVEDAGRLTHSPQARLLVLRRLNSRPTGARL